MINVSNATKEAWMSDREKNHLVITFPNLNLTYDNESIEPKSLSWTEALSNADSMEFVGCIASSFGASIYDIPDNVKGEYITVTFQAGNTDIIPIFKGYVESVEIESNSLFKKIKAYDALYRAGQVDVASWYARLALPMTLGDIRRSLMTYVGLTEVADTVLPNDDVVIQRTLENPDTIKGLTVIKSICQLNGACGIINRDGEFEYRYVKETMETVHQLAYHESLRYEEYYCNPIQRVQIRDMEEDAGVTSSGSGNKYIVQGNMFAYELASDVLYQIASNILEKIEGFTYHPMRSVQNGLPFFEVGDTLECTVSSAGYGVDTFLILSRSISGVQFCRDTYESRGTQDQSEYITDIQAQVNVLQRTTKELKNLSSKTIDYLLPATIEESNISDGSGNNVLQFNFDNGKENEKTSFYAICTFDISTTVNQATETYGDCILTASYILDGQTKEVMTYAYGDGTKILTLNYLIEDLDKGNHTFIVRFTLSGGSLSSMRFASAYILAASTVSEDYSEEYDITNDYNGEFNEDVLPEGLTNDVLTEEAYKSGAEESMIKIARAQNKHDLQPPISNLSEWFLSKYILMDCQYYGEIFYRTNGYYRKDGKIGDGTSTSRVIGKPVGWAGVYFYIPIKRITGYHFFKYKAKTIQDNGDWWAGESQENYVRAGVAAVVDGEMVTRWGEFDFLVDDWTEYSLGISTLPYVDYIVLDGNYGSPGYKDMRFVR